MNIEEIEANYYRELEARREIAKNFKGQVAGRHPDALNSYETHAMVRGYLEGYQKAKETYQFTEDDVFEFYDWMQQYQDLSAAMRINDNSTRKELLDIWKEQQIKDVYYELENI